MRVRSNSLIIVVVIDWSKVLMWHSVFSKSVSQRLLELKLMVIPRYTFIMIPKHSPRCSSAYFLWTVASPRQHGLAYPRWVPCFARACGSCPLAFGGIRTFRFAESPFHYSSNPNSLPHWRIAKKLWRHHWTPRKKMRKRTGQTVCLALPLIEWRQQFSVW